MIKIVLAGTPNFAVPIFEEIIKNFNVVAIISQPDRPSGRGHKFIPTPTKQLAEKYSIPCYQPEKIGEIYDDLAKLDYDFLITAAFGQFIPSRVLSLAKKLNLNIHGSLLPKYRGASPIQYSLLNGDKETGISLMEMIKEMDAGDIFKTLKISIDPSDTSDSLMTKLSQATAKNITNWINEIIQGDFKRIVQDSAKVSFSPKLEKEKGFINSSLNVNEALNIIRAYSSNPCAYSYIDNKRVKIFFATKEFTKNAPIINLKDGVIYLTDYMFDSKKRVVLK
ncbi:methionyl-tRNA formyltransferase [Mycoplasmopsis gallinarum]